MTRLLAIDYGEKRIGIAISDGLGLTAQPKPFIYNNETIVESLKQLISENDVVKIYIGLPKDTRGGESKKSIEVRSFAEKLKKELALPIEFVDERFSTVAATKQLDASGLNRKKQRHLIDSQAAAFILQGILDKTSS
tara:strand:+ start:2092 stop:2502 length:411 start_codon:yes stop_codon:yes gene_type:complete